MSGIAAHNSRTPGGHPEGYIEAFANLYRNFALALRSILAGEEPAPETLGCPWHAVYRDDCSYRIDRE